MNIVSIDDTRRMGGRWKIEDPSFRWSDVSNLPTYEVQKGEDMRIDLVMNSIYDDQDLQKHCDIILYLNGIDNPLNIREGMLLHYPPAEGFDELRYEELETNYVAKSVKERLGVPNKTTRKDSNRKKFLEADYSLPPVVLKESRPGVVVTTGQILVGGIN